MKPRSCEEPSSWHPISHSPHPTPHSRFMAHQSLLQSAMRPRNPLDRRCTYLVVIERDREPADDLRNLASYLSTISVAKCEVIVVDGSPSPIFESNRAVLRWVSRHVAARPRHRNFN